MRLSSKYSKIPILIEVFKTTIEKHYHSREDLHPDSIRVVKPKPDVLVYLACPKDREWKPEAKECVGGQVVYKTVVPKTPENLKEVREWERIGVPVKWMEEKVYIEPRPEYFPPAVGFRGESEGGSSIRSDIETFIRKKMNETATDRVITIIHKNPDGEKPDPLIREIEREFRERGFIF
jgi:hypothetical protein